VAYEQIAALPKETILQAMSMTDGLSQLLQQIPGKINAFLNEFLAPDSVPADEDEPEGESKPAAA
jgi:hypothetical protein